MLKIKRIYIFANMRADLMKDDVFKSISHVAMQLNPKNGKIILFGSQARGDAQENSDWDILVLIDKDKIEASDHDKFAYPFWELGWQINAMIHPLIYTLKEWESRSHSAFHQDVETEGIVLC